MALTHSSPWLQPVWVTRLAVAIALTLAVLKAAAATLTGSLALLGSMADSLMDAAASTTLLLALIYARRPPDARHRFGHGRMEPLASLGQSGLLTGTAVLLALQAIERMFRPHPLHQPGWAIAVMVISIAFTLVLVLVQRRAAAASGSVAVTADAAHYLGDIAVNGGILVALLGSALYGWAWLDPIVGLLIAGYLAGLAWKVARLALVQLMDEELPAQERGEMEAVLRTTPSVLGWHNLRTRRAGPQRFVQVHLEVDGRLSLEQAHAITADAAVRLKNRFDQLDVVIHADPVTP